MDSNRSRRAISGLLVVIVVSIIIVAAGVGSYVAFNQIRSTATSISSTVTPETTNSPSSSSSSTAPTPTSTTSSSSSPTTALTSTTSSSSSRTATNSTSFSTQSSTYSSSSESQTTTILTSTLESTLTTETSTICSTSTEYNESGLENILTSEFPPATIGDVLGNFTQMSVHFNVSATVNGSTFGNSSSNVSEIIDDSYTLVGTQSINGTIFTLVNFNIEISAIGTSENQSGTIYFDPNWNATLVVTNEFNYTDSLANSLGQIYMLFFELPLVYTSFESSLTMGTPVLHEVNQTTASFGNTTLDVTNYNATVSVANDTTTSSTTTGCGQFMPPQANSTGYLELQLAALPHSNTTILTSMFFHAAVTEAGMSTNTTGLFQIDTLTLAPISSKTESTATTTVTRSTTTMTSI